MKTNFLTPKHSDNKLFNRIEWDGDSDIKPFAVDVLYEVYKYKNIYKKENLIMTSILTIANPVAALTKKENGTPSNRAACAGAHLKNDFKTALKAEAVAYASIGAVVLTHKIPAVSTFVEKSASKLAKTKIGKHIGKVASSMLSQETISKIKGLPTPVKLAAAIAVPTLSAISIITTKGIYNAGKIDQKYEDKAQLNKLVDSKIETKDKD